MKNSKEFMLLFRFELTTDYQPTEAEEAAQHQQWGAYIGNLAMQEKLVSTHQLGFSGKLINAQKEVIEGFHISEGQTVGGNMVISAANIDEAVEIGKDCPIIAMGGNVEVREILAMD